MIELEVVTSIDREAIGARYFFLNNISIGRSLKCEVIIKDSKLTNVSLYMYISKDNKLFVKSHSDNKTYHVNTKKISGTKNINIGDQIQIGDTTLKIKNFVLAQEMHQDIDILFEKFKKQYPESIPLLKELQYELLFLQTVENKVVD